MKVSMADLMGRLIIEGPRLLADGDIAGEGVCLGGGQDAWGAFVVIAFWWPELDSRDVTVFRCGPDQRFWEPEMLLSYRTGDLLRVTGKIENLSSMNRERGAVGSFTIKQAEKRLMPIRQALADMAQAQDPQATRTVRI